VVSQAVAVSNKQVRLTFTSACSVALHRRAASVDAMPRCSDPDH